MRIKAEEQDIMLEHESGARHPVGIAHHVILWTAILWSIFQLWVASPLVYSDFVINILGIKVLNDTQTRSIHLALALFLAFLVFPMRSRSPRDYIPVQDWLFALCGAIAAGYIYFFYEALAQRSGMPTQMDLTMAAVGVLLLLEAARRALGWPMVILAVIFLGYAYAGQYMPDLISHKGQSLRKLASHQWLSTEGVFGIALGVSSSFVFLFVLFGALLDKAGAGNYFIKSSFALLGHLKGGPAKAAVLASGFTGIISGSSIANVVTTGTFTIPLMKRVGFTAEKAGAVEVAGSVNGQIMPPVMGAAAFLMIEYVGIPYIEVIKHAFIPAVISYIALLYIVHLEALKQGIEGIKRQQTHGFKKKLLIYGINISSLLIVSGIITGFVMLVRNIMGEYAIWAIAAGISILYIVLLYVSSRYPPLEVDDPNSKTIELPDVKSTIMTGLHYLLPLVVLIWALMVERLSPGLSAFYATLVMIFILLTQKPIIAKFRGEGAISDSVKEGVRDLLNGLEAGARNMIAIAIATAAAGIIVGTVTLTGIANIMPTIIDSLAGDSLILVLLLTAVICLILGMGLPTTANYIVVSSIMVGVIQELGAKHGLVVPLIAVHLFVFYFGIMADVTPPVGLASFAAAAVSGGDPIRTGIQAFWYSIRTAILPFIFIFNTDLLLIDVNIGEFIFTIGDWSADLTTLFEITFVLLYATTGILLLTAVLQGYFIIRNRWYETVALLLISVTLFRPGLWMNILVPPYQQVPVVEIEKHLAELPAGAELKLRILGEDDIGEPIEFYTFLPLKQPVASGRERLAQTGLTLRYEQERAFIDNIAFFSIASDEGLLVNNEIIEVNLPQEQPDRRFMFIPAFLLLLLVVFVQRRRRDAVGNSGSK